MPKANIHNKKHQAHLAVVKRQERIIKYIAITISVLVVALVAYALLAPTLKLQFGSVAKVNGERITPAEFQKQVKFNRVQLINRFTQMYQFYQAIGMDPSSDPNLAGEFQRMLAQLDESGKEELGQTVLDQMIEDLLIRQAAAKQDITVSEEEINTELQQAFGYYPNGTPTVEPSATPFTFPELNATQLALVTITPTPSQIPTSTQAPTATPDANATATATIEPTATATTGPTVTPFPTATPITLEGYETQVAGWLTDNGKETGFEDADLRRLVEGTLYRRKMLEFVTKDMKPFEEQVWARHILVATEEEANAVLTRLAKGEDWSKIAAEVSTDTSNKDKGGDLEWFAKGRMLAEFDTAVFALKIGEISAPVKTTAGYHIIQVLGHEDRPVDAQAFEQLKQIAFDTWLKEQRDAAEIKIDEFWKTIVPTTPVLQ